MSKYNAKRTYSALCDRIFASQLEANRAEELELLQRVGVISDLQYQVRFLLCAKPKISITIDFAYTENGEQIYEDAKGVLTRDFRTKLAWLKSETGIDVILHRQEL